jgi:hypothetical protein
VDLVHQPKLSLDLWEHTVACGEPPLHVEAVLLLLPDFLEEATCTSTRSVAFVVLGRK